MDVRFELAAGWQRALLLALPVALGAGVLLVVWLLAPAAPAASHAPTAARDPALSGPPPAAMLVQVSGGVARPGLYRLPTGDRGYDAIAAAGGLTADADQQRLPNLATQLHDGAQIAVPVRGATGAPGGTGAARGAKVSLNSATEQALASVPGFTPELAAAAVQYRAAYGGFTSTRELQTVLGMSQDAFLKAKPYVTV
jgi:competence protein ComEA